VVSYTSTAPPTTQEPTMIVLAAAAVFVAILAAFYFGPTQRAIRAQKAVVARAAHWAIVNEENAARYAAILADTHVFDPTYADRRYVAEATAGTARQARREHEWAVRDLENL